MRTNTQKAIQFLFFVLHLLFFNAFPNCRTTPRKLIHIPNAPLDSEVCRKNYGERNFLYPTTQYAGLFMMDRNPYNTIILGDSTMDIAKRYSEFYSVNTGFFAVSGNTLCDMLEQIPSIFTPKPEYVLISTGGGNDAIRKIPEKLIIETGKQLILKLRNKYPKAKILLIGIHPTKLTYVNMVRNTINEALAAEVDCYINPDEYFEVSGSGEPAPNELIDSIHYTREKTMELKSGIQKCGAKL